MTERQPRPPLEAKYPARIGAAMFVLANACDRNTGRSCGTLKGLPKRSRQILGFEDGAALSLCSYCGELRSTWQQARRSYNYKPKHVSWVIKFEYDGSWSRNLVWNGSMDLIRLSANAVQIAGPYIGHPYYVAYAKIKANAEYRFGPHTMMFPRFQPQLFPMFFGIGSHDLDFNVVIKLCRQLIEAFGKPTAGRQPRWQSKKASERKGSRLQASLELFNQAMRFIYAQDTCMRLHIALEALFACHAFNKSTIALICPLLLQRRIKPATTLERVLSIYHWRNSFFHGDEPPYQDPPAAEHMRNLGNATESGVLLLKELYREILGSEQLKAIFNSRLSDEDFMKRLFKVLA